MTHPSETPIVKVTDTLSVAGQISASDVPRIAGHGVRSVVCHRPDGEGGPDQPPFEAIAAACAEHGITAHHQPFSSSELSQAHVDEMAALIDQLPAPLLIFCRTGTRSITLWAIAKASDTPADELLRVTQAAGYDLNHLAPLLRSRYDAGG